MRKVSEAWLDVPGVRNLPSYPVEFANGEAECAGKLITRNNMVNFLLKDKKALNSEFERVAIPHLSHIYTAAVYLTKDQHEAEDLSQETYVRAFRFFRKFESGTNCRAWLLSIQRHLFINRYRQKKKQPELIDWEKIEREYESLALDENPCEKYNPERLLCSEAVAPEVEKALKALPEDFRLAVILVDVNELTYEETARILDCKLGTVRSRLSRGRRLLQVALKGYARENGFEAKVS